MDEVNGLFGSDSDSDDGGSPCGSASAALNTMSTLVDSEGRLRSVHPSARVELVKPHDDADEAMAPAAPAYVGPIVLDHGLDPSVGGCRGFTAATALAPGTLLLAEKPVVLWRDLGIANGAREAGDVPFEVRALAGMLARPDAKRLVHAMGPLYPERLEEYADQEVVESLRADEQHTEWLANLPSDYVALSLDEVLRLVLALRSNAFASGFYLYFAMFNHSCTPNCIKYQPTTHSGAQAGSSSQPRSSPSGSANGDAPSAAASSPYSASEVRATRWIAAGEPLTLSYLDPREQARQVRDRQLWDQFRFKCQCPLCSPLPSPMASQPPPWLTTAVHNSPQDSSGGISASSSSSNGSVLMVRSRADIRGLSTAGLQALVFAEGAYDPGKYKSSTVGRKELETRAHAMVLEARQAWKAAAESASTAMVAAAAASAAGASAAGASAAGASAAGASGATASAAGASGATAGGGAGTAGETASAPSSQAASTESKGREAWARSLMQAWAAACAEAATEVSEEADLQEELETAEEHLAGVVENASRRGLMRASLADASLLQPRRASPTPLDSAQDVNVVLSSATSPPMTLPAALEAATSLADGLKVGDSNNGDLAEESDGSDDGDEGEAGKDVVDSKNGNAAAKPNEKHKKGKKKKGKKGRLGGRNRHENSSELSMSSKSYSSAAAEALVLVHRVTTLQQRAARVLAQHAHPLWPRVLKLAVDASAAAAAPLEDQDAAARHNAAMAAATAASNPPVENGSPGKEPISAGDPVPGAPPSGEAEAMMAQFLSLNRKLLQELTRGLPGPDHPDLASTYHDLANGLKALLRRQPTAFVLPASSNAEDSSVAAAVTRDTAERDDDLSEDDMDEQPSFPPPEWASVSLANKAEQRERRNHERIRALYAGR